MTPGKRVGRILGFFTGWWNFFGWIFATAALSTSIGNMIVMMWAMNHPDYVSERWHVFIAYLIVTWTICAFSLFANKWIAKANYVLFVFVIGGWFITVVVCAAMPKKHASNPFVWKDWVNDTGYS